IVLGLHSAFSASADREELSQHLSWRKNKSADARLENLPLPKVLARLSAATGWKILVQPGLDQKVSVQFQNASQGDALKLLLGGLSYALVPQTGGGAKLYVYKTSLSDATALIEPDRASRPKNWLEKEMIISLAPGSKQDVDRLAAELGGKVVAKSEALNAYRLEFTDAETAEAAREKIANRDDLASHDNYGFDRPANPGGGTPSPESLFPLDSNPVARGDQVTVALVDTAIQPLHGKMNDFILGSIHIRDDPGELPQDPLHATSMAHTLLNSMALAQNGLASDKLGNVRILPIDIYGSSPSTSTFEVAQGLHRAIQSGAQVINLSLGGAGESPMVDYLLEGAFKKGILVFASAGNSPTTDLTYPAANPNTIAVTASDWQGNIAPYANRGAFVDVKAPGSSKVFFNGQNYISAGTSTATAYISGQAAALAARGYSSSDAASMILRTYSISAPPSQGTATR
ncbi:MAG: S8 family serine peptidase, partial [Limisphaerales bacterium]